MKTLISAALLYLFAQIATAQGLPLGQPKGFIQNDAGGKCWFTQTTEQSAQYFQSLPSKTATLIFDNPLCMKATEIGHAANMLMINNTITRPYSHPDAKFKTVPDELLKTSLFQIRGKCIQSATYPSIGVLVEYLEAQGSIYMVKHAPSIGHCSNQTVAKFQ